MCVEKEKEEWSCSETQTRSRCVSLAHTHSRGERRSGKIKTELKWQSGVAEEKREKNIMNQRGHKNIK